MYGGRACLRQPRNARWRGGNALGLGKLTREADTGNPRRKAHGAQPILRARQGRTSKTSGTGRTKPCLTGHTSPTDPTAPSASALRKALCRHAPFRSSPPNEAGATFRSGTLPPASAPPVCTSKAPKRFSSLIFHLSSLFSDGRRNSATTGRWSEKGRCGTSKRTSSSCREYKI